MKCIVKYKTLLQCGTLLSNSLFLEQQTLDLLPTLQIPLYVQILFYYTTNRRVVLLDIPP